MKREAPARVDIWYDDFLGGMSGLEPEERGVYWTVCCLIWNRKGRLTDHDQHNAYSCGCSTRRFRQIKQALVDKGKIVIEGGLIHQRRAEVEWDLACKRLESAQKKAAKSQDNKAENSANPMKTKETGSSSATITPTPTPSSVKEESESTVVVDSDPRGLGRKADDDDPSVKRLIALMEARGSNLATLRGQIASWYEGIARSEVHRLIWDALKKVEDGECRDPVDRVSRLVGAVSQGAGSSAPGRSGPYQRAPSARPVDPAVARKYIEDDCSQRAKDILKKRGLDSTEDAYWVEHGKLKRQLVQARTAEVPHATVQ